VLQSHFAPSWNPTFFAPTPSRAFARRSVISLIPAFLASSRTSRAAIGPSASSSRRNVRGSSSAALSSPALSAASRSAAVSRPSPVQENPYSPDGFNAYPDAVDYNFGSRVDYAMLVKEFGSEGGEEARRYAPPRLIGAEKITVTGVPDEARICTSHIERSNWTLRGHLRRMTRLSNGFSRKRANLRAALALYCAY
jgi:hypothetical protein